MMPIIKILTINSELESAKRLEYNKTETWFGDYSYKQDNDIIVRWGNSILTYDKQCLKKEEFKNVINPSKNIRDNCCKDKSIKKLAKVVFVPTIYESNVPSNVLAVIRPYEHTAGKNFNVVKGPFKIERGFYGTRYIKTDYEYRVWFCGDKTMCGRRVKMKINEETEFACRSNWGYEFLKGVSKNLHQQTLLAAKTLGLDLGAADILFFRENYYFLELNSAPSVDHRRVKEFFQKGIEELSRVKFPHLFGNTVTNNNDENLVSPVVSQTTPIDVIEIKNDDGNKLTIKEPIIIENKKPIFSFLKKRIF